MGRNPVIRRVPLRRSGTGLSRAPWDRKRTAPLKRSAPLPYRSAKTAKVYREQRVPLVQAMLAAQPWCQVRWDENCRGHAEGLHEVLSRGRGGSIVREDNCVAACHYCNGAVSDNPAEAEARGFLKKSGHPAKAVPRG
jgi:hypothetical protein